MKLKLKFLILLVLSVACGSAPPSTGAREVRDSGDASPDAGQLPDPETPEPAQNGTTEDPDADGNTPGKDPATGSGQEGDQDAGAGSPQNTDNDTDPDSDLPESADPEAAGPYGMEQVTIDEGIVHYPAGIASGTSLHPVIAWANGTAFSAKVYKEIITHWVSHGFVVIASKSTMAMVANDQIRMLKAIRDSTGHPWSGRLDPERMGVSGHSQGGSATVAAAADPMVKASIPMQSGGAGIGRIKAPTLLVSGSADTICPVAMVRSAYKATRSDIRFHGQLNHPKATHWWEIAETEEEYSLYHGITTAWWRWHLMGDESMAPLFSEGGLYRSGEWSESEGAGF